jgi:hypothetical protein
MLAAAIRIQARFETDVGTVVPRDDRFRSITKVLRRTPRLFLSGSINIDKINVGEIDMQLFEPIGRTPRCATSVDGHGALRRLLNDRPEFVFRRHSISSHEHIVLSRHIML